MKTLSNIKKTTNLKLTPNRSATKFQFFKRKIQKVVRGGVKHKTVRMMKFTRDVIKAWPTMKSPPEMTTLTVKPVWCDDLQRRNTTSIANLKPQGEQSTQQRDSKATSENLKEDNRPSNATKINQQKISSENEEKTEGEDRPQTKKLSSRFKTSGQISKKATPRRLDDQPRTSSNCGFLGKIMIQVGHLSRVWKMTSHCNRRL